MNNVEILCDIRNHVAFITLNRPAALNALSLSMILELRDVLSRCAADVEVRAILIQGAGGKAFCAGGDIRALYQSYKDSGVVHRQFFAAEYALDFNLHSYPKPYIAVMNGITMGGGMGIAQGSALRVAGERTRIAMPEVAIGLFPDVGGSFFLSRLEGALGPYLALTGVQIDGADAVHARLADVYLGAGSMAALMEDLTTLQWTTDWRGDVHDVVHQRAAQSPPPSSLRVLQPAIDRHFSHSSIAAIMESLNREVQPDYRDWALKTAALMAARSPTMLAVTLRQLQRGKTMSLADCLRMELGMVEHCFDHGDFIEGIRALIIDKDNSPQWLPRVHDGAAESDVDAFFNTRWPAGLNPLAGLEEMVL